MDSTTSDAKKILRVGSLSGVHTLRPWHARDNITALMLSQVFDTLYSLPEEPGSGQETVEPKLCSGWLRRRDDLEVGDEVVYEAPVRSDRQFSDGTALTPRHVTTALSRVASLTGIQRLEAQGDRVLFRLERPDPSLALALTTIDTAVALEQDDEVLGTGPFLIAPGSTPRDLRLLRNERHPGHCFLDEVELKSYPADQDGQPRALLAAIAAGEVDYTDTLSRDEAVKVSGMRMSFQTGNSTAILFFNTERLTSSALRRALAAAVNRREVTAVSHQNVVAFEATSLLPPISGFIRDRQIFDLDEAKRKLDEAEEVPESLELVVVWTRRPYLPDPDRVAALIAEQIGALGIEVRVTRPRNSDEYFARQEKGEFDLMLGGWVAESPDPADFLDATLRSDRVPAPHLTSLGCCNLSRYRSTEIDKAIDEYRDSPREYRLERIFQLVDQEAPLVPLTYGSTIVLSSWRLSNVKISRMGFPDFSQFQL